MAFTNRELEQIHRMVGAFVSNASLITLSMRFG